MEQFIKDQIVYGLKYMPKNLVKSKFIPKSSEETEGMRDRGFICGVCHPSDDYEQIKGANIGWVRIDIPFPYNRDGSINPSYESFKARCCEFQTNGIKVMAVTPYPHSYISAGIDVRTPEGEEKVREIARFIITDMKDAVSGLQITNEMGIPHFILPLNMDQAVRFIGIQLEEMYPLRGDIIIGYNSAGPQADLHNKIKDYYKYCDYIGVDIYIGCMMVGGFMWMFDALVSYLWAMTGKPILIQEFGYISGGKPMPKKDKLAILNQYGAKNERDAKNNIVKFVDSLPEYMQAHIKHVCGNDESRYFNLIFRSDFKDHIYKQIPWWVKIPGYDHTYEGQAKFYSDIFARLYKRPYVAGAFIYMYHDAQCCHICGQEDCPTETQWGLTDRQGNPKPSYYAVRDALTKMKRR